MKARVLGIVLVVAGCGVDPTRVCLVGEGPSSCGEPDPVDTFCARSTCNPLTQTGCNAGEKCTWVLDQAEPRRQHIACVPAGTVAIDQACEAPVPGRTGWDACVRGAVCHAGTCKVVCDHHGGAPGCGAGQACAGHDDLAVCETAAPIAGVCESACDPLTQVAGDGAPSCGSADPAAPDRGCYGYGSFLCEDVEPAARARRDRDPPLALPSGGVDRRGCAPGYVPFLLEETGSTTTLCSGLCAALPTDSTPAHVGNAKGDPTALGKRPDEPAPLPGRATCAEDQRGSEPSSMCRYLWPYLVDDQGMLPPGFDRQDLGVCMAIAHYQYDSDGDMLPDAPYPDCATLPPRSAATPGPHDDAYDWGCQPYDPQQPRSKAVDLRAAAPPVSLVRHVLR